MSILLLILMALVAPAQTQVVDWASPTQKAVFQYGPFPQCASGGFGSSKTYAYCLKALWLSDVFPKNRGVIFRSVAKDLRSTTMATFEKLCPSSAYANGQWNRLEGRLRLNNGSEVLWLGLDNPDLEQVLKGLEINWFFGDQAEDVDEQVFDTLLSRLGRWDQTEVPQAIINLEEQRTGRPWRWRNPVSGKALPPQYAMLACNPDTELHWIYRRFHPESSEHDEKKIVDVDLATGEPTGQIVSYRDIGYKLFHMPSTDNKFLTAQNKANLLSQDEAFVRRYVRGEWGLPEGAIHVVDPPSLITFTSGEAAQAFIEHLRQTCTLHRTLDHGDSAPTCCVWWAVDRDGNVFGFREYYLPNALISTHRQNITGLSEGERYDFNLADPSIFNKISQKHGGRWSVNDEYCLSPETKILTADLRHVRLDSIKVGDTLAGFDEGNTSTRFRDRPQRGMSDRAWRTATVEGMTPVVRPSYRLVFDDGTEVVCSAEHRWLANPSGNWRLWRTTEQLQVGHGIWRAIDVWADDPTYQGGYLAAAFDGEGWLTQADGTNRIGLGQCHNGMLSFITAALDDRGIRYGRSESTVKRGRFAQITVTGARMLALLGAVRPARLLPKFSFDQMGRIHAIGSPKIISKTFLGDVELIGLQTSTRTCIAQGLMSHNCDTREHPEPTALWWQPADNNEMGTRNRVNEYLKVDPNRIHPVTKDRGAPRLFFVMRSEAYPNGCSHTVRETRAQRRVKVGTDMGRPVFSDERDPNIPDHGYDNVRYFIASRAPIARPRPQQAGVNTFEGQSRLLREHARKMRIRR